LLDTAVHSATEALALIVDDPDLEAVFARIRLFLDGDQLTPERLGVAAGWDRDRLLAVHKHAVSAVPDVLADTVKNAATEALALIVDDPDLEAVFARIRLFLDGDQLGSGLDASRLVLEVTETVLLSDVIVAADHLRRLRECGRLAALTLAEIRRLLNLIHHGGHAITQGLHWSTWRRWHQAQARRAHVRRHMRLQALLI